jgi:hypothetical protein
MKVEIGTRRIWAQLTRAVGSPRLSPWKSSFAVLAIFGMVSNLVAFVVSSGLPSNYIELDPLVQPGSLLSLARTEGIILAVSLVILTMMQESSERMALQGLITGFFTADAVNDIILISTGNSFLAMELAWVTAAAIPAMVGMSFFHGARNPPV